MTVPLQMARTASSISPMIGMPALGASRSSGIVIGTPGLRTICVTPSSSAASDAAEGALDAVVERQYGKSTDRALLSVRTTSSPRAARKFAEATPDFPAPMTQVSCSSQFERRQRDHREDDRDDPEADDDLRLLPARQLEVVMQRRHLEDAPPGDLERGHLQDHRQRLEHEQAADEDEQRSPA